MEEGNGSTTTVAATALTVESAKDRLGPFLAAHPNSAIEKLDTEGGKRLGIMKPWGEDGLIIYLPDDLDALAEALNNVHLPERFTAIWHKDKKNLEVIWTAYPLVGPSEEVKTRSFRFQHASLEYDCEFGRSSDRLLMIAEHAVPVAMSDTGHRNLQSFHQYARRQERREAESDTPKPPFGEPMSFWIRNLEWDEDRVLSLARHLNFYMTYYDSRSPTLFIHPVKTETAQPRQRYLVGRFPPLLDGREIEDDLLDLWAASRIGDAGRRFVYCYRIIEYASHSYVERGARIQVRRLLSAPHALSDVDVLTDGVIAAALSSKAEDPQMVAMLLKDAVDPHLLWKEIDLNRGAFTSKATFDGGFVLSALISADATSSSFAVSGLDTFGNLARQIRNHLSHGRDRKTQTSITPTIANFRKLEPWVSAIAVAAGEVVNFRHLL